MDTGQTKFLNSPYFVPEPGNWHLKPGAPDDVVDEFTEYMAAQQVTPPRASVDDILAELRKG